MNSLSVVALVSLAGCTSAAPWLRGEMTNHPRALVGEWVDVQKTTAGDSSIWVLEPNGYDGGIRITRNANDGGAPHVESRKYGYWYVRNGPARPQELCVNQRPGREPPSCTTFEFRVDSTVTPPRRGIRLIAYIGAHHTGERLLVERR